MLFCCKKNFISTKDELTLPFTNKIEAITASFEESKFVTREHTKNLENPEEGFFQKYFEETWHPKNEKFFISLAAISWLPRTKESEHQLIIARYSTREQIQRFQLHDLSTEKLLASIDTVDWPCTEHTIHKYGDDYRILIFSSVFKMVCLLRLELEEEHRFCIEAKFRIQELCTAMYFEPHNDMIIGLSGNKTQISIYCAKKIRVLGKFSLNKPKTLTQKGEQIIFNSWKMVEINNRNAIIIVGFDSNLRKMILSNILARTRKATIILEQDITDLCPFKLNIFIVSYNEPKLAILLDRGTLILLVSLASKGAELTVEGVTMLRLNSNIPDYLKEPSHIVAYNRNDWIIMNYGKHVCLIWKSAKGDYYSSFFKLQNCYLILGWNFQTDNLWIINRNTICKYRIKNFFLNDPLLMEYKSILTSKECSVASKRL